MATTDSRPTAAKKTIVSLSVLSLGLVLACLFLLARVRRQGSLAGVNTQQLLENPEVMGRVVELLVAEAGGDWDSHPDPQVGRVMRPSSSKTRDGIAFAANRMGIREREYELPKPPGTVRVVLLGDSFIYGTQLAAKNRAGVFLQEYLSDRARASTASIEVLHIGLISWNYLAEAAFLRRQIGLLQPDLVIQLCVSNDIDDCYAVRGFGAMARFSSQHRSRADTLIQYQHPSLLMGIGRINYLTFGLDYESKQRYAEAARETGRMIAALERMGCEYLHLFRWEGSAAYARGLLLPDLPDDRIAYLSNAFSENTDYWVAPEDRHFNRPGMEIIAKYLYATIQERELLPALNLERWEESVKVMATMDEQNAADRKKTARLQAAFPIDGRLDFEPLDEEDSTHFNGGVDAEGLLSPYASFTMRPESTRELSLRGRGLNRPEIDGLTLTVRVDGILLGTFQPGADEPIDLHWALPSEVQGQEFLTLTIEADDYAYVGDDLRHCVSFQLLELAIE